MDFSFYPHERTLRPDNSLDNLIPNVQRTPTIPQEKKMNIDNSNNPKYQKLIDLLTKANNTGSGYGIDLSDCDLELIWNETFAIIEQQNTKNERQK